MSQKTLFNKTALAVAVALVSTSAWSAGFQLNEFSSSGLGRAYSGEGAIADDAGNASRNPALIMMFDRPTFSAGAVFVEKGKRERLHLGKDVLAHIRLDPDAQLMPVHRDDILRQSAHQITCCQLL